MAAPATEYRVLGIIDRAYRGAVESQFFDAMYGAIDLRDQFGRMDLALRGGAVTMAVAEDVYRPVVQLGDLRVDTLPDYRASAKALIAEGIRVFVDEPDLRALGFEPSQLIDGAICVDTNEMAATWSEYDGVWFV
jgi:hypothetical protein